MIVIDAGVPQSIYYPLGAVEAPEVVITSSVGDVGIPCHPVAGGVIVEFPGEMTAGWPATTGTGTLTAIVAGERVEVASDDVTVIRDSADRAAQRQAVEDAVEACETYAAAPPPDAPTAIAATQTMAGYLAFIGRYLLDRDLV